MYLASVTDWDTRERGYSSIQGTRPQTLGYGLTDSPAALAAWILEKWRLWADTVPTRRTRSHRAGGRASPIAAPALVDLLHLAMTPPLDVGHRFGSDDEVDHLPRVADAPG